MRIAISGTQCIGKTTLIDDFIKNWPMYKRSGESYRNLLKEHQLPSNKLTTKDSQRKILECLLLDIQGTRKSDYIIFDRSPLDNIIYSLWSCDKKATDIDKAFIDECIPLVKDAMKAIDIIFFLPITKVAPVKVEARDGREVDNEYRIEIDNIFKAVQFGHNKGKSPFFHKDDAPPIIEVFGNPLERIELIKFYVNSYGDSIDNTTTGNLFSTENLNEMEQLLREQTSALKEEKETEQLKSTIIRVKNSPGYVDPPSKRGRHKS